MKRTILALSAVLICWSASAQKKNLTLEQIANDKFPNVEKYLLPPVWESGDILQVSTMEFGVLKRERKFYNVKTGAFEENYKPQESPQESQNDIREDAKKANSLINGDGMIANPTYSPDGKLMAFTNNGEYVMMLNKDFSDNPLDSEGIYYTVIHEMGHLLGLPDSYCTEKDGVTCDSPNCPKHGIYGEDGPLGENGFGRYCVMANRSYVESHMFTDFSSFDFEEYPILCPHCLDIAQDWANGHLGS